MCSWPIKKKLKDVQCESAESIFGTVLYDQTHQCMLAEYVLNCCPVTDLQSTFTLSDPVILYNWVHIQYVLCIYWDTVVFWETNSIHVQVSSTPLNLHQCSGVLYCTWRGINDWPVYIIIFDNLIGYNFAQHRLLCWVLAMQSRCDSPTWFWGYFGQFITIGFRSHCFFCQELREINGIFYWF